jgi:microcystin degradation protein MlrC
MPGENQTMRIVIAMMKHETNTFSPVPTDLARFARGQTTPFYGDTAYQVYKGTGSGVAAFIDLAEAAGAEIILPVAANAWPSGPVHDDAYEHICERICSAVAQGCDAILLDLHGAMVTQSLEDGEGELLTRIRRIAPDLPIGVALDMHTNLYPALVEQSNVIAGYQTYPHLDLYETAQRAGKAIFAMLRGEVTPAMTWGNRPMLPH